MSRKSQIDDRWTRDLTELAFLIQDGLGEDPDLREAVVRRFAPELFQLAFDLHPADADRLDDALGMTAETIRTALANHRQLREFDSIRNWLFSVLAGQARKLRGGVGAVTEPIPRVRKLALVLRYGHGCSVEDIAEILGLNPDSAHRHLRRGRRRLAGLNRLAPGHAGREIENALDERITWNDLPGSAHIDNCADCRRYLGDLQTFEKRLRRDLPAARPAGMMDGAMQAILDHLSQEPRAEARARRSWPLREAAWAGGAVAFFLLVLQLLNPVLSIEPPVPTPIPTQPPPEPAASDLQPPDYSLLAERLAVWEPWTRWESSGTISGVFPATTGISFSSHGSYAAFGSFTDVVLWDLLSGTESPLAGHESVITALSFGGENWLASGSEDGTVRVWDLSAKKVRFVLDTLPRPVSALAFSPDLGYLAVGGNSGVVVWSFSSDGMREVVQLGGEFVRSLAFSSQGSLLAAVDRSGALNIWHPPEFTHELRFAVRQRFNTGLAFSPSGNRIATASMDGTVKVFRLTATGQFTLSASHIFTLSHPTWVSDIAWLGDQLLLAVAGSHESSISNLGKRGVYFWEMGSGLPAAPPLFHEEDGGVLNLQQVGPEHIHLGSYNRAVHVLTLLQDDDRAVPAHFGRANSALLPTDRPLIPPPDLDPLRRFPLGYEEALERIGYAQQLSGVFSEAIPAAFTFQGAAFDHVTRTAVFAFTRSFALDHDEWVFVRLQRVDPQNPFPGQDDWIGAGARVEPIQFGQVIGELVSGEWLPAAVDQGASGILRWTNSPLTRFRWNHQNGIRIELITRSEIGVAATRWDSLFLPLILAMIRAGDEVELVEYEVAAGDTCLGIAARFGTTTGRIIELNALSDDCGILIGQTLSLPLPPAFGPVLEADLDCDGTTERLRSIPDPRQPSSELYMGFLLEDIPGGEEGGFEYATFWTYTQPEIAVNFFGAPFLMTIPGECGRLIAITGYGGNGEDSGLRIFRWNGETMDLVLASAGFIISIIPDANPYIFLARSLAYDAASTACTETITTYEWQGAAFVTTQETVSTGVECFSTGP